MNLQNQIATITASIPDLVFSFNCLDKIFQKQEAFGLIQVTNANKALCPKVNFGHYCRNVSMDGALNGFIFDRSTIQYSIIILAKMEKHSWQRVTYRKSAIQPPARWGHSAVKVQSSMVIFGGYAESHYMNDLWYFNTQTMAWNECITYGAIPSPRSNCTIHYQPTHKYIVLFGGGGPHKQRYNDVHILDWETKQWRLMVPISNEKILWERTYHSSQLLYPYLIVFGGEGITDLDDLWAFNLESHQWTQLKMGQNKVKPCSRRFHSSVIIDNTFYVIAGCHDKYRCLCDIFSIDLSPFVKYNQIQTLEWKQLNVKNNSFLTRWGHTSSVFDGKIYTFGGRFSNDLQDILVLDPSKQKISTMKVQGQLPKPRRRHSAIFMGSNMIIFGGFNGQYFNDTHYINVFELPSRIEVQHQGRSMKNWVNQKLFSDYEIQSDDGIPFYVHKGLMTSRFDNEEQLIEFLNFVSNRFSQHELKEIITILYEGIGTINQEFRLSSFQFHTYESEAQKDRSYLANIGSPQPMQPLQLQSKSKSISRVVSLTTQNYCLYLQNARANTFKDRNVILNDQYCLPVNSCVLAANSQYFYNHLKESQRDVKITLEQGVGDVRIFQVMLNYLQTQFVVVPKDIDQTCWIALAQLAHYLCLKNLELICQVQLTNHINEQNCQSLLQLALSNHFSLLQSYCGEYLFRMQYQKDPSSFGKKEAKEQKYTTKHYFDLFEFDLEQRKLKNKPSQSTTKTLPMQSQSKQNYSSIPN